MKKIGKKLLEWLYYLACFAFGAGIALGINYIIDHYFSYEYNYIINRVFKGIDQNNIKIDKNEYYRDMDFLYVQNTDNFNPKNKEDLLNIYYTFLNSGQEEFTFYCAKGYKNCIKDMNSLIYNKKSSVSHYIYHFNHPFNDCKSIQTITVPKAGEITLKIEKQYTDAEIKEVNAKFNELYNTLVDPNDTQYNNLKRVHDYLINNTVYDTQKADFREKKTTVDSPYRSETAYGALLQGQAICAGFSDAYALFLDKMGIKNYRVTSETHMWNALELDGVWYHVDLTWDNAKYTTGERFLRHQYFLISTNRLFENDETYHNFSQNVYLEVAGNKDQNLNDWWYNNR